MRKDKYISLKEASEISGYSSDYIGQLIRSGKLPGKQIFANVVWMTTVDGVQSYLEQKGRGKSEVARSSAQRNVLRDLPQHIMREVETPLVFKRLLYVAIGIGVFLSLIFFYILATSVERYLNEQALQAIETRL